MLVHVEAALPLKAMTSNSTHFGEILAPYKQPSLLLGAFQSQQQISSLAVTLAAAAAATFALPALSIHGTRGGLAVFRTLRHCAGLTNPVSTTQSSDALVETLKYGASRAGLLNTFASKVMAGPSAHMLHGASAGTARPRDFHLDNKSQSLRLAIPVAKGPSYDAVRVLNSLQ